MEATLQGIVSQRAMTIGTDFPSDFPQWDHIKCCMRAIDSSLSNYPGNAFRQYVNRPVTLALDQLAWADMDIEISHWRAAGASFTACGASDCGAMQTGLRSNQPFLLNINKLTRIFCQLQNGASSAVSSSCRSLLVCPIDNLTRQKIVIRLRPIVPSDYAGGGKRGCLKAPPTHPPHPRYAQTPSMAAVTSSDQLTVL